MGIRYYRKEAPANKPVLSNGAAITFSTLDYVTGYFATIEPFVQQELETLVRRGEYGITEIDEAEYKRDYLDKKKSSNGGRPQREEIGAATFRSAPAQPEQPAPAVPAAVVEQAALQTPPQSTNPPTTVSFQPKPSKRGKRV